VRAFDINQTLPARDRY